MLVFSSNHLPESEEAALSHNSNTRQKEFELAFASHRRKEATSEPRNGLVVGSDDEVSPKLAENLRQCRLAPLFASTVVESRKVLARREVLVIVCNEWLADGTYEDVVNMVRKSHTRIPVVVVSQTGEWPEYLRAVDRGAFDYVAYPPISGDLQRAIRNALVSNEQNSGVVEGF